MTDRIVRLKKGLIQDKVQQKYRRPPTDSYALACDFSKRKLPDTRRAVERLLYMLDNEEPILFPEQTIVFARTTATLPALFTQEEKEGLTARFHLHELGELSNICVDYSRFLNKGFCGLHSEIRQRYRLFAKSKKQEQADYLAGLLQILEALEKLVNRYRMQAQQVGNTTAAASLKRLLSDAPKNFHDALQMQRIVHFTLWCGGSYHNTLGRFDQYMFPYLEKDMKSGVLNREAALELLEEYFLSFNIDSDLYPGMQQGDNGQSMVLGGITPDGQDGFNLLSELCLQSSLELKLIDPKINLRVSKDTPLSIYQMGTRLTKQGLGFPQYSNDDVVIEGLQKLGYKTLDARNYAVAACWEFIIPGLGMEIPNMDALCFASIVREAILNHLDTANSYEELYSFVKQGILAEAKRLCRASENLYIFPAPFASIMMEGCVERGQDVSLGCTYNNYGFHGVGLSTAADSLAAVKKYVYDMQRVGKAELLDAMQRDFEGHDRLLHLLRYEAPKVGDDDDLPDGIAAALLMDFSQALRGKKNQRGGVFRPGTGSAMYYLWHARELGATPDGRRAGEGLAANYSCSLFTRSKGPVSMIKSLTKPRLEYTINGGPLTIELHDTLFRSDDSVAKVAALIKSFIDRRGHQMQINAVNRETMLDAQAHPGRYQNLIVRVWGWSGYFVELDTAYQNHIIQRMELDV